MCTTCNSFDQIAKIKWISVLRLSSKYLYGMALDIFFFELYLCFRYSRNIAFHTYLEKDNFLYFIKLLFSCSYRWVILMLPGKHSGHCSRQNYVSPYLYGPCFTPWRDCLSKLKGRKQFNGDEIDQKVLVLKLPPSAS